MDRSNCDSAAVARSGKNRAVGMKRSLKSFTGFSVNAARAHGYKRMPYNNKSPQACNRQYLESVPITNDAVNRLANDLGYSQPLVSKHLRILRESGFVHFKVEAQRRIYTLDSRPLAEIDAWLSAYRKTWEHHVDKLSDYLDRKKVEGGREQ